MTYIHQGARGAEAGRSTVLGKTSEIIALLRASYERGRTAMIDAGCLTEQVFDQDVARLDDADFMMT